MQDIADLEIPGLNGDNALRFRPHAGTLRMSVSGYAHTVLERPFLRPMAAWFAGEAQPCTVDAVPVSWLVVHSDALLTVHGGRTTARLNCASPFGAARVAIVWNETGRTQSVMLSPDARLAAATWLRRADARDWARPTADHTYPRT
jgi:hypothetical protein